MHHRSSETSRRLGSIPGIGAIGATAIAATVSDPSVFKSGRVFAAWIGLVPRHNSTGGKERRYLRRLLIVGAIAVLRRALAHRTNIPG
jgi:transposase